VRTALCGFFAAILAAQTSPTLPAGAPPAMTPDPNMPRPIAAYDSVFIEELTWLEVRDAMRAGRRTVIIATGGVEQNGPYLATGKHNYILRAMTEAIARKLGNALVAPIVPFVPEGDIDPPTAHMRYPGSISVSEDTYRRLVRDIASSMKTHGFEHIILIGDSGGNQAGLKAVSEELSVQWAGAKTRIHHIPEFYDYPGLTAYLETLGIRQKDEGFHDDVGISSLMMTVDPNAVRMTQRKAAGKFSINGVNLDNGVEIGRKAVEFRANKTVAAIRKAVEKRP